MKLNVFLFLLIVCFACNDRNIPDVSHVKVDVQTQRFDHDFFKIDTNHVSHSLQQLHQRYPKFLQDYIFNILALPPHPDSSRVVEQNVVSFIRSYKPLKDSGDKVFTDFGDIEKEIRRGLQFVKHHFPEYNVPSNIITFIGPINSYGNILTTDALAVGLQLYMGRNYSLYHMPTVQEMYPQYISRRFEKEYIPVNCTKTIVDDMYPDNTAGKPLVEQMVFAGKKLYLLDQLMPEAADTLKTGYTEKQLEGCFENERVIWSLFIQNDLLYTTDPSLTRDYMNDAPSTQALGGGAPGFIGQFVGWQIVKKWMSKNEKKSLKDLMAVDGRKLFEEAKYKP